jgi:histidinol phosphatase-like PHP family hydrolase
METICFTDHFWDETMPGASPWYQEQNRAHVDLIREEIPEDTMGIRVLVGCETEFAGGGTVGLSRRVADEMDFINLPFDHFHMKDFVCPSEVKTPEQAAALWIRRFDEALQLDLPWHKVAFAHIDDVLSFHDVLGQLLDALPEDELAALFTRCARQGASIEINTAGIGAAYWQQSVQSHLRVFAIARDCGCTFTFGSDSHSPADFDTFVRAEEMARALGLTQKHLFNAAAL